MRDSVRAAAVPERAGGDLRVLSATALHGRALVEELAGLRQSALQRPGQCRA